MTEAEKMTAGKIYNPTDKELTDIRVRAHELCFAYNNTTEREEEKRKNILNELFPNSGEGLYLQGPLQVDYGKFVTFGKNVYANFNLVILDICPVHIGDNVFMGPNVSIMTPMHPYLPQERRQRTRENGDMYDYEYGKPIEIGADCWLAANVTVIGGVRIGEGCIIGAGSVVTKDIPPYSLAAGNPCRVIRSITKEDSMMDYFDAAGNYIGREETFAAAGDEE